MSALKYGIKYWAKIDRLIASRHINTRSFNNKLREKFWKHASNVVCGVREGAGQGMCELENAPEIQKYPNVCP